MHRLEIRLERKLDWDDLRYVLMVAEQGSLSNAARVLGVSHTTVLRRVAAFEEKNKIQVFERSGSGYSLNPRSQYLLSSLRVIEDRVNELNWAIARQGIELDGPVRITTSDSIAVSGLAQLVASFQLQHPKLAVEFNISNAYLSLANRDADITIRPAQKLSQGLVGERVCDLSMRVYATKEYLEQNSGKDYKDHKWLGVGPPLSSTMVGEWQRQNLPENTIVIKSSSFVGLRDMAETSLGMALLPCSLGDPSPRLQRVGSFPDELTTGIWVATHMELAGSAIAHLTTGWFLRSLRDNADIFEGRFDQSGQKNLF